MTRERSLSAGIDLYIGKASPQNQFTMGRTLICRAAAGRTSHVLRFIALGFLALPIIEIALFIKVGQSIGLWPTLALVIGAGIAGSLLLRLQGIQILSQMRSNVSAGRLPARDLADAMMIGLAAVLLVLPGFLSDIVALALLLPPVRGLIYDSLAKRVTVVNASSYTSYTRPGVPPEDRRVDGPAVIDLDDEHYRPK